VHVSAVDERCCIEAWTYFALKSLEKVENLLSFRNQFDRIEEGLIITHPNSKAGGWGGDYQFKSSPLSIEANLPLTYYISLASVRIKNDVVGYVTDLDNLRKLSIAHEF
jgi:hypothetical protein